MKTIKEVRAWAKSVNLVYGNRFRHHELKTRTAVGTRICGGIQDAQTFIASANDFRRWAEWYKVDL